MFLNSEHSKKCIDFTEIFKKKFSGLTISEKNDHI